MRRAISNACLASLLLPIWLGLCVGVAKAQSGGYPSKPLLDPFLYSQFVPGVFARKLSPVVAREMNGIIVIENRPGASGVIGATEVAKAAPDGYTFLYGIANPLIAATVLVKDIPYDPFKNFTLITKVQSKSETVLIASPNNKANSLREFLDLAKSERATYGSFGPGSFPQLMMEQLALDAGVKLEEVAYRSPPQAIQEVTANRPRRHSHRRQPQNRS